jgi:hypothetical protein
MPTPNRAHPDGTAPEYAYVGPAFLTRTPGDSTIRKFRGRVVRHTGTGALRFFVNRTSSSKVPRDWPGPQEWTDDFTLKDIEWIGNKPDIL